jgi:putative addiction module component (TIGR02574 family)
MFYAKTNKKKGVITVTSKGTELLQEALSLSPDERAQIAERLLSSLDTPADRRIEELWAIEAEDRLDAFERGELKSVPANEVFDQIDSKSR